MGFLGWGDLTAGIWKRKRVILAAVLTIAVLTVILPYRDVLLECSVFAPDSGQHTLVLDAGHGGMDGGAVADDGTVEQDINLAIVKKCQALAGLFGIPTILTREDENSLDYDPEQSIRANKVADIHARERITNQVQNPVFLSVHLNKFSDSSYSGAQVFWSKNNADGQVLAEQIQSALLQGLPSAGQRQAKQAADSIYLMKVLECPAVIVECGFLSNEQETELLRQDAYQKRLALCIINGYCQYIQEQ